MYLDLQILCEKARLLLCFAGHLLKNQGVLTQTLASFMCVFEAPLMLTTLYILEFIEVFEVADEVFATKVCMCF